MLKSLVSACLALSSFPMAYSMAIAGRADNSPTITSGPVPTAVSVRAIETPQPIQPGMVDNCDTFYKTKNGDYCYTIAYAHSISVADFIAWNPSVGLECGSMQSDVYVCVGTYDKPITSTTASPTTTTPPTPTTTTGNGIETPLPTQDGMTTNCNKFHYLEPGDVCFVLAGLYNISITDVVTWNPAAGSDCTGLRAWTWACVGVIA